MMTPTLRIDEWDDVESGDETGEFSGEAEVFERFRCAPGAVSTIPLFLARHSGIVPACSAKELGCIQRQTSNILFTMIHWHRIGLIGAYFSIRCVGVSTGTINTFSQFTVLTHPIGFGRSKHSFAALTAESKHFIEVLENGKCGQEALMNLANERGSLQIRINEDGEYSIDFSIGSTSKARPGAKGSVSGAYAIESIESV